MKVIMLHDGDLVDVNLICHGKEFLLPSTTMCRNIDSLLVNGTVNLLLEPSVGGTNELQRRSVSDLT